MLTHPSAFLLPFLVLVVYGLKDTKEDPFDVLQVKHLLVEQYKGPLSYNTLGLFRNVEDLHLRNSNFTHFNPSMLLALPNLKRLLMNNNNIMEPVDYDISGCCQHLVEFELSSHDTGDLLQVELNMIKAMKSVENLVLHSKKIYTLTEGTLISSSLLDLTMMGCELNKVEDNAFKKINKLKNLDLRFNNIADMKKDVLTPLTEVRVINLKGNLLEKLTTEQFPPLPNLETLNVAYNPIIHLDLEGIKKIAPKLKTVDITGTAVEKTESGGVRLTKNTFVRV